MKKIFFFLLSTFSLGLAANAQAKPLPKAKSETVAVANRSIAKPAQTAPASTIVDKRKKDGSLDMRYKENKEKAVPLKKDGTPDLRFKKNKKN